MAGQAAKRTLTPVPSVAKDAEPAEVAPKPKKGGRPRTRVSAVVGDDSAAGQRELLVVLRRKCAVLLDATKSASAAERLMTRLMKYDEQIRAIDAEQVEAEAAAREAQDEADELEATDESFDAGSI